MEQTGNLKDIRARSNSSKLEALARKLLSFDELLSFEDARELLNSEEGREILGNQNLYTALQVKGIFQVYTTEFVQELAKNIRGVRNKINSKKDILEVCAGDGKLSCHLRKQGIPIMATDDYSWSRVNYDPSKVENLDHYEALKKYNPEIVLASWLPNASTIELDLIKYPSTKAIILVGQALGDGTGAEPALTNTIYDYLDDTPFSSERFIRPYDKGYGLPFVGAFYIKGLDKQKVEVGLKKDFFDYSNKIADSIRPGAIEYREEDLVLRVK